MLCIGAAHYCYSAAAAAAAVAAAAAAAAAVSDGRVLSDVASSCLAYGTVVACLLYTSPSPRDS